LSSDTRERILAVANELFTDQGYDGTSLREIADRLGITKAALYYHFPSKDDILVTLLEPFDVLIDQLLTRLEATRDVQGWGEALTWIIEQVFDHLDFFRLVDHNRHVLELQLQRVKHDHSEMHTRVEAAAHAAASSIAEEVRMIAALGAVTGFDDWAPTLLKTADPTVLKTELTAAARDVLGLERTRARARARTRVTQPV
jgi:AcrR family transcriptional regulator